MPVLLYLTVLSTRMWNVADEVSLTPNYTQIFFIFFLQAGVTPLTEGEEKKENRVKHMEARAQMATDKWRCITGGSEE